jgi:hypothetical protein
MLASKHLWNDPHFDKRIIPSQSGQPKERNEKYDLQSPSRILYSFGSVFREAHA